MVDKIERRVGFTWEWLWMHIATPIIRFVNLVYSAACFRYWAALGTFAATFCTPFQGATS
jgi:hypothetical protein